jgi:ABC-2 type transport system permease protein
LSSEGAATISQTGNQTNSQIQVDFMPKKYSQLKAAFALAKASLFAMLRSPTSVVFSLLFPIIFIIVFGAMVDNNAVTIKIGIASNSDTANQLYRNIAGLKMLQLMRYPSSKQMQEELTKGHLAAILIIQPDSSMTPAPHYHVQLLTSGSSADKSPLVQSAITEIVANLNSHLFLQNFSVAAIDIREIPGRVYRSIDFILPGQLGFSLLMAGVFGSAFLLYNLRQSLVLKRFFATPIKRPYLILGEMLSRLFFQVIGFMIMVALGYYVFHFTLIHGIFTFLEMLLLSVFGLIIFMGMGFIISGVIENESSIAPVANTLTLPQILLCGLFFPVENYPEWLQSFCKFLPLTFLVDGLRKIAFEGTHIWQMPVELTGLTCWALVVSFITVKVFRWE